MADIAEQGNARTEEARELARKAGRLYEPVRSGGGLAVAAVFSSSVLWDFVDYRLNELPDEPGSFVMSQIITGSQLVHLHWALCLIEESGGESCMVPGGQAPHWAGRNGNVNWSQSDMGQLRAVSFLDVKKVDGNTVISHGDLTRELISGFLEMLATVKKA
jgi:hypothetical protein